MAACGGMKIIRAFLVDEQSRRARALMSLGAKRKQERTHRRNELRSHVKVVSWFLHTLFNGDAFKSRGCVRLVKTLIPRLTILPLIPSSLCDIVVTAGRAPTPNTSTFDARARARISAPEWGWAGGGPSASCIPCHGQQGG